MFRVSPSEINTIKLNDPVFTNSSFTYVLDPKTGNNKYFVGPVNFTQLSNEQSTGLVHINYSEPCCSVIAIETDNIFAQNRMTGEVYRLRVPLELARTIKNKDFVFIEPGQANAVAILQSSWQSTNTYPSAFSFPIVPLAAGEQISSDRWVLSPSDEVKGNLGRLNTHFDAGIEWGIDVFTNPARQPVMSRSTKRRGKELFAEMAPGIYSFRLNMAMVEPVPIVKGMETRLKSGTLDVRSSSTWTLWDESGMKIYSSPGVKKLALPVGNYKLTLNGQNSNLSIRDGETISF